MFVAYRKLKGFLTKQMKGISNVRSVIDRKTLTLLVEFVTVIFLFSKKNFITKLHI